MDLISIPGGDYELGWRELPEGEAREAIEEFVSLSELKTRYSPFRKVRLQDFQITATSMKLADLAEVEPTVFDNVATLKGYCDAVDRALQKWGFRLPTEDEFEVALGGQPFPWGDELPEGIPHENWTDFDGHHNPSPMGLVYNPSTYVAKLVRCTVKLSDGGEAVCGGYPWPLPWLSLGVAHRLDPDELGFLHEFMEEAEFHRVKL